jgi:hypothetical protein
MSSFICINFFYRLENDGKIKNPLIFFAYLKSGLDVYPAVYQVSQGYYGPFSDFNIEDGTLKAFLKTVEYWQIKYDLKQEVPRNSYSSSTCYLWTIT